MRRTITIALAIAASIATASPALADGPSCLAGEEWDGTNCVAMPLPEESIGGARCEDAGQVIIDAAGNCGPVVQEPVAAPVPPPVVAVQPPTVAAPAPIVDAPPIIRTAPRSTAPAPTEPVIVVEPVVVAPAPNWTAVLDIVRRVLAGLNW